MATWPRKKTQKQKGTILCAHAKHWTPLLVNSAGNTEKAMQILLFQLKVEGGHA
jgi:hypothetical protein